jgi:hypothetical protein
MRHEGGVVFGAQGRVGCVRVVGQKLMPRLRLTDDEGASPVGMGRAERSQLDLGRSADARVDGVRVWV